MPHVISRHAVRGTGLVEFALVTPLLLLLMAGVLDYGRALSKATAVANAARVGAQYGTSSPSKTTDTAGIQAAAVNSAPSFTGLTVTPVRTCQCPGGSSVSCTGNCGGARPVMYLQVTVTATSSGAFSYSGLPFTGRVMGQATMRAQ